MTYQGQVFGITTYDALFKFVLNEDRLRPSFFEAFLPGIHVESSQRIDDHMNPLQELQNLRGFLGHADSKAAVEFLNENPKLYENLPPKISRFLKGMVDNFDDFKYAFPEPKYRGTMDFACRLDNGEYALIEMQVMPEKTILTEGRSPTSQPFTVARCAQGTKSRKSNG